MSQINSKIKDDFQVVLSYCQVSWDTLYHNMDFQVVLSYCQVSWDSLYHNSDFQVTLNWRKYVLYSQDTL